MFASGAHRSRRRSSWASNSSGRRSSWLSRTTAIPDEDARKSRVVAMIGEEKAKKVIAEYPVRGDYANAKDALVAATTDAIFVCPARTPQPARWAKGKMPSLSVYRYFPLARPSPSNPRAGVGRTVWPRAPLPFSTASNPLGYQPYGRRRSVERNDDERLDEPAASGDPTPGLCVAAAHDVASDPYLDADDTPHASSGLRTAKCDFWNGLGIFP